MADEDHDAPDQATIDAFLKERDGYLARGLIGRVAEVDAQLKAIGAKVPPGEDGDGPEGKSSSPPGHVEEAGGGRARSQSGRRGLGSR